jgi:hypothetical protein
MGESLSHWHDHLAKHFNQLHATRESVGKNQPIFALEHGLNPHELQSVTTAIREHIADFPPKRNHSLPWIVYSAEIGYQYSGDEYWQTFEEKTPGWTSHGDRHWIRERFKSFQKEYGGAQPTGTWAEHFSIICWPITHAILPQDLQRELARILYEIRHSFSAELFESPSLLGEYIEARSWNSTSRFQNFSQQILLVGQIATALLFHGDFGSEGLIHPVTLQRISEDLDRERRGRNWLRSARRFAQERAQIRGLAVGNKLISSIGPRPDETREEVTALGIEPRLVLRPSDSIGLSWDVLLEIPDLSPLLLRFPSTREIISNSRCNVAGSSGRPLARGRCLHGVQRIRLARWPRADEVLLQFEKNDPQLEYLLRTECLIRPGPAWIFRIASDGLGYEQRSLRVRPREKYIYLYTKRTINPSNHLKSIDLNCNDIQAVLISLPPALTADWEETLSSIGLEQTKTVEVWPAGLSAAAWDGDGYGEWLSHEQPCLAIRSDYPIDKINLTIKENDQQSLELTTIEPGDPIFIELPQLPLGLHSLRVSAKTTSGIDIIGDLNFVIRIRETRSWTPGLSSRGPLIVQMDPTAPTMEQLWEGQADVELRGPIGRKIQCTVSMFERDNDNPTITKQLPPLYFNVTASKWREHFDKHFRRSKKGEECYDSSRVCMIEFTTEELGSFTIQCEREFTPLRWVVRQQNNNRYISLINDTDSKDLPDILYYSFETPMECQRLNPSSKYEFTEKGGLYLAQQSNFTASIIVVPLIRQLADLRCTPRIKPCERSSDSVISAVKNACLWGRAKSSGDFVTVENRRFVLHKIIQHIFLLLGGERWAKEEIKFETGQYINLSNLVMAVTKRKEERNIVEAITLDINNLSLANTEERLKYFTDIAIKIEQLQSTTSGQDEGYNLNWLSEFAMRLASDPAMADTWAATELRSGITHLLEKPTIARTARFFVLATNHQLKSEEIVPGEIYPGWRWE